MIEMLTNNFETLSAIGTVIAAGLYWWESRNRRRATERADIAETKLQEVGATSAAQLYQQLSARITALEADHARINGELDTERRMRRRLEDHVALLERMMRAANMTPPALNVERGPHT